MSQRERVNRQHATAREREAQMSKPTVSLCDMCNDVEDCERCKQMAEALITLLASLEWEKKRSGTTYNGYESARAALRAAGVD